MLKSIVLFIGKLKSFVSFSLPSVNECLLFQGAAGSQSVTVTVGNMSETATGSFTYDTNLTPQITSLSPNSVTGVGKSRVVFY